jgi:hypothetical protein
MPYSVVYLGPSLSPDVARTILDAEYLPPVRRGDVNRLLQNGPPAAIGIIDGQFFQNFSISPKEVLKAIEAGVKVYGSSSMGALRAVELAPYGMIGVGEVFRLFASGELDADDEVAMVYDSSTLKAISDPMVNMRVAFESAKKIGIISSETQEIIVNEAKKIYYPDRTYRYVLSRVESMIPPAERISLKQYLESAAPDAKRDDAIELLHRMKSDLEGDARA